MTVFPESSRKPVVGYVLWFMICGLWFVVCGLWFMVCGLWFVVCGLCFMVCGLWFVFRGLWFGQTCIVTEILPFYSSEAFVLTVEVDHVTTMVLQLLLMTMMTMMIIGCSLGIRVRHSKVRSKMVPASSSCRKTLNTKTQTQTQILKPQ